MITKENLKNLADKLPSWFLSALLVVIVATACDSGPTTGGTGNGNSSGGEQPNTLEVNPFLEAVGVPTVAPVQNQPLFAP